MMNEIRSYNKIEMDLKTLLHLYKCLIMAPDFEGRETLLDLFRVNIKEKLFSIEMEKERIWELVAKRGCNNNNVRMGKERSD